MKCPYCGFTESKVLETRETDEDNIRRRRECLECNKRFTTYEQIELTNLVIVKKDDSRETFDRQKLMKSIQIASQKRPVSQQQIEETASKIESKLRNSMEKEVTSKKIGELVMEELQVLDKISYVRFASVYREFQDIESFKKELEKISKRGAN